MKGLWKSRGFAVFFSAHAFVVKQLFFRCERGVDKLYNNGRMSVDW